MVPALRPVESLTLVTVSYLLLLALGPLLAPLGLGGIALAQVAVIGGPTALFWLRDRRDRAPRLGLTLPTPAAVAGALLVGASFWYLNLLVAAPIAVRLGSPEALEELERRLSGDGASIAARLAVVAVAPALCEELLLRGALARSLAPRLGRAGAIACSAVLFASLHMSPVRLVPTGLFGAVLGYVALASGSTPAAMICHFANNTVAVALSVPATIPASDWLFSHPWPASACALAATVGGLTLVRRAAAQSS